LLAMTGSDRCHAACVKGAESVARMRDQ